MVTFAYSPFGPFFPGRYQRDNLLSLVNNVWFVVTFVILLIISVSVSV